MRLDDESDDVSFEDRRGQSFGGGGPLMIGGGGLGLVAVVVIGMLLGVDPRTLLGSMEQAPPQGQVEGQMRPGAPVGPRADDAEVEFSRKVMHTTKTVWTDIFAKRGLTYSQPTLVAYRGQTSTACGAGQSAMGPFYCPGDRRVYLDMSFFDELATKFGAAGDFARGYVIAHEVGHHVQNLLGVSDQAHALEARSSKVAANRISVKVELQADCYAGVWANHIQAKLDPGDIDQGLRAASAVGDDTLQKEFQGRVVPDAFTHGTSAQRVRWFKTGYQNGDMNDCDTFNAKDL